jgi:hypothetical protein
MAMHTFDIGQSSYLNQAVHNLAEGLRLLTDARGQPLVASVQNYLEPLPTTSTWMALMPGQTQLGINENMGTDYDRQIYNVIIRWVVGTRGEMFDGELSGLVWQHLPLLINYINQHPALVFHERQAQIENLSPEGVRCTGATRQGTFRDDPEHIGIEVAVTVPFHIEIPERW